MNKIVPASIISVLALFTGFSPVWGRDLRDSSLVRLEPPKFSFGASRAEFPIISDHLFSEDSVLVRALSVYIHIGDNYILTLTPDYKNLRILPRPLTQGGVVITFDDDFIQEWYEADAAMQEYGWKATFCVRRFDKLDQDEISKLVELQSRGHEIAWHGFRHLDARSFIESNGVEEYLNKEILPKYRYSAKYGLKFESFSYPGGRRSQYIDSLLFSYFKILRGTTYGQRPPSEHNCFFDNQRIVWALGLDSHYSAFSFDHYYDLLMYAKSKNNIVIFYGHIPVEEVTSRYQTSLDTLRFISHFVNVHNMNFYTLSDLYYLLDQY